MENMRLRQLAGLLTEKKQLSDVKAKVEVPEGTFTKKAASIVSTLIKLHDGDVGKASKALTFFINRAGKDCDNKDQLDAAKALFKEKIAAKNESLDSVRKLAGMIVEKKKAAGEDMDDMSAEDESTGAEGKKEEEEEELPKIVTKIAKQAEGKDVEALEKLIMKVYEAGFKDGKKAAEEGEDGKKSKKAAPSADDAAAEE
jgi:hypothetical protein